MKRNYGIDLLRIVAMGFVINLHLTGVGGICGAAALGTRQFYISQLFRIATFCAVNCYALISGYVGWSRSPRLSGLLSLWLKVIAFCVAITVFTQLRDPAAVGAGTHHCRFCAGCDRHLCQRTHMADAVPRHRPAGRKCGF
jgi:surface polysaccharide O-acyltransferase-like enzyme